MFERSYWEKLILEKLTSRSVLWLSGVRRSGKTVLCRSLDNSSYFDCELPRVRQQLEDPEAFFSRHRGKLVVLDEIHRLVNPSEVLKIGADHFPHTKIVATGSSTLAAKRKFRDTLTGRKHTLWLTPSILADMKSFGREDLDQRMLKGGLPPFLLSNGLDDYAYAEWVDSYWAKDLQELFVIERKAAFMKLMELVFRQSGNLFQTQALSTACEISRQTVQNYIDALQVTLVLIVLRPFSGASAAEVKSQPKIFAFDTGFVCYFKGIDSLRDEDRGMLLEHLVLGELLARFPKEQIYFWRDKQKHEVDFILKQGRGNKVTAIECKNSYRHFNPSGIKSFRRRHPDGKNLVVSLDKVEPWVKNYAGIDVEFVAFEHLPSYLDPSP